MRASNRELVIGEITDSMDTEADCDRLICLDNFRSCVEGMTDVAFEELEGESTESEVLVTVAGGE